MKRDQPGMTKGRPSTIQSSQRTRARPKPGPVAVLVDHPDAGHELADGPAREALEHDVQQRRRRPTGAGRARRRGRRVARVVADGDAAAPIVRPRRGTARRTPAASTPMRKSVLLVELELRGDRARPVGPMTIAPSISDGTDPAAHHARRVRRVRPFGSFYHPTPVAFAAHARRADPSLFDKVVNLCKRRGFVFPSAEIYGGFRSTYDYGPLGVLMLRNVKDAWWRSMVQQRDDVVGLDASILSPPAVWEASGHLANFTDPLVDCRSARSASASTSSTTRTPARAAARRTASPRPASSTSCSRPTPGRSRAPATRSTCGPRRRRACSSTSRTCSRRRARSRRSASPRSASRSATRSRPGNFVFRTREFEQMEMEFFVPPDESQQWYEYWCQARYDWYVDLGMPADQLRLRPHDADELSHYSSGTSDVEFLFPWGWDELEGIANRGDYDLTQHAKPLRRAARVLRPDHQRALRAPRDRAGRRRHPHDDGLPHGGLRRGGGQRRDRAPCCASTPASRRTRSPCCRCRRRTR